MPEETGLLTRRLVCAGLVLVDGFFQEVLAADQHAMLDAGQRCPRLKGSPAPLPQPEQDVILVQHAVQLCQAVKATRLLLTADYFSIRSNCFAWTTFCNVGYHEISCCCKTSFCKSPATSVCQLESLMMKQWESPGEMHFSEEACMPAGRA